MFSVYIYDKTFDGLLTAVFDAYFRKTFPDALLSEGDALPLFYDELHTVVTDAEKAGRVWRGLQKKVSTSALGCLTQSWLSELPEVGILIFRYIRKAIDAPRSIETNFAEPDVLRLAQILQEVTLISFDDDSREAHLITGMLDESLMDKDEKLFQQLWKTYFKAICIKERMNPRKHKQDMPVRYWKYLTEKQKVVPLQIKTDF